MKLPDKPSELIKVALADLALCMGDKAYRINFNTWHSPDDFEPQFNKVESLYCKVCFAGAVIAKSLKANPNKKLEPSHFDYNTEVKLEALDNFRQGKVHKGLRLLNVKIPTDIQDYQIEQRNYDLFVNGMNNIIKELQKFNL